MKTTVLAMILACALSAAADDAAQSQSQPSAGGGQQAAAPEIKDPNEYNAYVAAIQQKDPAAKTSALEAFLTQYPNSVMKTTAFEVLMGTYLQAGNQPKVMETAKRLLTGDSCNIRAIAILTSLGRQAVQAGQTAQLADLTQYSSKGLECVKSAPKPAPAPASVKAKYEGGVVGYRKSDGTLNFDDANGRLLFRDKTNKELFSIPYKSVVMAWPDTHSRTSTTGHVIAGTVPYGLGLPALLMKNKTRYVIVRYQDPDTGTEGSASFKIGDKDMLYSVLDTLGDKAELTQRGDAYVRRKQTSQTTPTSGPE